jgi:RHH-type rel operon transcriptional repressor/antitoxin RelB
MIGARFDLKTENRLNALVAATHRTKSYYLKEAMRSYLDANEEALLTIARYEEQVRQGTLQTIPMAEILKELNFDESDLVD